MPYIDKDRLKEQACIVEFATYLFGEPRQRHRGYCIWDSPFRTTTGRTPSFTVYYNGLAVDYGDGGAEYDIYALAEKHFNIDFKSALNEVQRWYGGAGEYVSKPKKYHHAPSRTYKEPTLDELFRTIKHYPIVQPYVEQVRKVDPQVAFSSRLGGIEWAKYIEWEGKTYKMPVPRAVLPYMGFGASVHGWVTRRVDSDIIDWMETHVAGMFEQTRFLIAKERNVHINSVTDADVLNDIQGSRWTPKGYENNFNDRLAMERYVQKGRRSIFGIDEYMTTDKSGNIVYTTPYMVINSESEFDTLCAKQFCPAITYKPSFKTTRPIQNILKGLSIVYISVQNDDAGRAYARRLYDELVYVKENSPSNAPKFVVDFLYTPKGYKDLAEMHQQGELEDFLRTKGLTR